MKTIKRSFVLGHEWLYYKIYCGVHTADMVLKEVIAPLTAELLEKELISQWFFVRYRDPDPHLRLRFKLNGTKQIVTIIQRFNYYTSPYLEERLIWKIQTDTYVREFERYGINTMEFSEQFFYYDSELIINALSSIEDEEFYFLFVLKCVDGFLDEFKLNYNEKLNFYRQNSLAYKEEFNVEKRTKLSLIKKYRSLRQRVQEIMDENISASNNGTLMEILEYRNQEIATLTKSVMKCVKTTKSEIKISDLLESYVHMFVNRAFRDKQRFYEMVVFEFLFNYHKSRRNENH